MCIGSLWGLVMGSLVQLTSAVEHAAYGVLLELAAPCVLSVAISAPRPACVRLPCLLGVCVPASDLHTLACRGA